MEYQGLPTYVTSQVGKRTSSHLVKSIDLHGEAVDAWHGRHGLQIWDVGGKISLEGNIVEKLVAYVRLLAILKQNQSRKNPKI